ncbi:MAG: hypothetical protein Q4C01_07505 [Clostridia bacterium]|nr:hypothetical protein [Clostridia bacterium]
MKRFLGLIFAVLLILPHAAVAENIDMSGAKAALIAPLQADEPIEEKNSQERYSVAGLCKLPAIVTLAEAFDKGVIKPDTEMQVSQKAASIAGPTAFLEASELVKASELMKAAVMISAGDAIYTLGENAFGSEQVFLQNIDVTLRELGISESLTDCVGTGSMFTAVDLMKMGRAAAESKTFTQYAALYMDELVHDDGRRTELVNANRMIRTYSGCYGLMTGSSREDGYCGVFVASRNDMDYICVVIGSKNSEDRFEIATTLFDYVFANFSLVTLATAYEPLITDVEVKHGDVKSINLVPHQTVVMLQKKGEGELVQNRNIEEVLSAPLSPDIAVGTLTFLDEAGMVACEIELYPQNEVKSYGFLDILKRLAWNFLHG